MILSQRRGSVNDPADFAIMFGLSALVILTFGALLLEGNDPVQENMGVDNSYFQAFNDSAFGNSNTSFTSARKDVTDGLKSKPGEDKESSEESIFTKMWSAVTDIGKIIELMEKASSQALSELGINSFFWSILTTITMIVFAVITYAWFRGRG